MAAVKVSFKTLRAILRTGLLVCIFSAFTLSVLSRLLQTLLDEPDDSASWMLLPEAHGELVHSFGTISTADHNCWRHCSRGYNNVIMLTRQDNPKNFPLGGMGDRLGMFRGLLNIAAYLCAKLYVPSPATFLEPYHARGTNAASLANLTWSDLLLLRVAHTNTADLLVEFDEAFPPQFDEFPTHFGNETKHPEEAPNDFLLAQAASWNEDDTSDAGFVWHLKNSYWFFDQQLAKVLQQQATKFLARDEHHNTAMLPYLRGKYEEGCSYSSVHPPPEMSRVIDQVWSRIYTQTKNASIVGYLHIRRGDVKGKCDTSPKKMRTFLDCSFLDMPGKKGTALLLSSDERQDSYRREIGSLIEQHAQFLDLDKAVEATIQENVETKRSPEKLLNNYFIFQTLRWVAQKTSYQLQQRNKSYCRDCINISSLPQWEKRFQM